MDLNRITKLNSYDLVKPGDLLCRDTSLLLVTRVDQRNNSFCYQIGENGQATVSGMHELEEVTLFRVGPFAEYEMLAGRKVIETLRKASKGIIRPISPR
jgi:hypothetical protein